MSHDSYIYFVAIKEKKSRFKGLQEANLQIPLFFLAANSLVWL